MIPNNFINNSSYAPKETIKVKENYNLFSQLEMPKKEIFLCQLTKQPKQ